MKIPGKFGSFLKKTPEKRELYLSLLIDNDHVAGAAWYVNAKGKPELTHAVARRTDADSWEERIVSADEVITALEERTGTEEIHKVIFGLPYEYLTPEGEIRQEIRGHLKQFSTKLSLTPIGFVPVHHAIAHRLKQEEGVPPSVILIGYTRKSVTVSVYKVGNAVCREVIPSDTSLLPHIEQALTISTGGDVLPSRMLLYGMDMKHLEALKSEMTRYPWPTKVNFLHFPKIEIVPPDTAVTSVSLAGASELTRVDTDEDSEKPQTGDGTPDEAVAAAAGGAAAHDEETEPESLTEEEDGTDEVPEESDNEAVDEPAESEPEKAPEYAVDEVSNVRFVPPESVGFHSGKDVLANEIPVREHERVREPVRQRQHQAPSFQTSGDEDTLDTGSPASASGLKQMIGNMAGMVAGLVGRIGSRGSGKPKMLIAGVLVFIIVVSLFGFLAYGYPSATVEVSLNNQQISETASLTVDPEASAISVEERIIPGRLKELSVTGEKTVPATGKKKVGDPAKGTVTVYNKSLSSRTFKKGSVLVSGSLKFTIDDEVKVASATESIGSITFGKGDIAVTASAIGTQSNLPANTEFVFDDLPSSTAIARNDKDFAGGTSRDVIVVSRADYDGLVEAVTDELVEKAKQELGGQVSGSQKLIDETIETEVTEKIFTQELDEESKDVHGTIKLTVSGIAYDEAEAEQVFSTLIKSKVPSGYALNDDSLTTTLSELTVNKDDTISGEMAIAASASPAFETEQIAGKIKGKSVSDAEREIRALTGVQDVKISVRNLIFGSKLPMRDNRIAVSVQSK